MIRSKLLKTLFVSTLILLSCEKEDDLQPSTSKIINIPDANFKNYLVNNTDINTNKDNEITESEALNYTGGVFAQSSSISDVTGIEYFTNITRLSLFNNNLTSIDVSNNTKVTQLLLESNDLINLDVSKLTVLVDLKVHSNELTSLNIANGNNANITRMELQGNSNLTCVKVDGLPVPTNGWNIDATAAYGISCD